MHFYKTVDWLVFCKSLAFLHYIFYKRVNYKKVIGRFNKVRGFFYFRENIINMRWRFANTVNDEIKHRLLSLPNLFFIK